MEKRLEAFLVVVMGIVVIYGVLKLIRMQTAYDAHVEPKAAK